ncbi:unnamed protein product [Owenia fusiformis]|uniref:Uncharacterized protein n=1 Tax=Owenia fusiformis TaxID=6347 RepID=A0A8J1T528_OWEFU|nr:unnamed protein product [Owenia fusiformis]
MDVPNAIVCEICQQEFTQQSAYNKHLTCTHGIDDDLYPCKKCDKVFYKEKTLKEHLKNVHAVNPKYKCTKEDCEKVFSNSVALSAHFKTHDKEFVCSFCAHTFSTKCNLQRHLRTHTGVKPYSCPHCPKKFAGASNLRMHLEVHEGIKEHACGLCNRHFNRKAHLKRHMIRYHKIEDWKSELIKDRESSKKANCYVKGVKLKDNGDLETDSDVSDEDVAASGNDLDDTEDQMTDGNQATPPKMAFNVTLATLEDCNIKGNRSDGLIKCKKCQQKFRNELSFQNHLADTHGLQQPYCCSVCAQVFEDRHTLKEHAKQHKKTRIIKKQQIKQFKMNMDIKAESEKPAYNTNKIFPCSHCDEVCYSRSSLNFHMNVHVENADYICKFCKAGFVKQYHLTKHMRQCQVKQMLKASRRAQRKSFEHQDNSDISFGEGSDYIKSLAQNSIVTNVLDHNETSDNEVNNSEMDNNIVDTNNVVFDENVVCEVVETEEVPLNAPLLTSYVQVQQDDHSYVQQEDRCFVTQQEQDVVVESNDGTQIWVIQADSEQQEATVEEPHIEQVETQEEEVETHIEHDQANAPQQVQYVEEQSANQPQMVMVKDRNGRPMIVPVNLV